MQRQEMMRAVDLARSPNPGLHKGLDKQPTNPTGWGEKISKVLALAAA
jgi:hypothetical protein